VGRRGAGSARHKSNVFLDLSGYSPKYIPPQYVQFANTLLQDQMLFGSDYPFIMPERWLADFEEGRLPLDGPRQDPAAQCPPSPRSGHVSEAAAKRAFGLNDLGRVFALG